MEKHKTAQKESDEFHDPRVREVQKNVSKSTSSRRYPENNTTFRVTKHIFYRCMKIAPVCFFLLQVFHDRSVNTTFCLSYLLQQIYIIPIFTTYLHIFKNGDY
jgi:hypothetical protein